MDRIFIKNFATEQEAELAQNLLQAYKIKAFVQSKGVHSSGIPSDKFGADLFVLKDDAEEANDILEARVE